MLSSVHTLSIWCVYVRLITRATLLDVRWERLFDDLEAQLDASSREELAAEVTDRTRTEVARVHLIDRLRHAVGAQLDISVDGAGTVRGTLARVGQGWLLVVVAAQPELVIASAAILAVRGLSIAAVDPTAIDAVASRLDFAHIMRAVARDRGAVTVSLRDRSSYVGTIDRVGADFVDLAEHPSDEPRRAGHVTARRTLPFAGIAVVRPT
jgi:hypothetical protein